MARATLDEQLGKLFYQAIAIDDRALIQEFVNRGVSPTIYLPQVIAIEDYERRKRALRFPANMNGLNQLYREPARFTDPPIHIAIEFGHEDLAMEFFMLGGWDVKHGLTGLLEATLTRGMYDLARDFIDQSLVIGRPHVEEIVYFIHSLRGDLDIKDLLLQDYPEAFDQILHVRRNLNDMDPDAMYVYSTLYNRRASWNKWSDEEKTNETDPELQRFIVAMLNGDHNTIMDIVMRDGYVQEKYWPYVSYRYTIQQEIVLYYIQNGLQIPMKQVENFDTIKLMLEAVDDPVIYRQLEDAIDEIDDYNVSVFMLLVERGFWSERFNDPNFRQKSYYQELRRRRFPALGRIMGEERDMSGKLISTLMAEADY